MPLDSSNPFVQFGYAPPPEQADIPTNQGENQPVAPWLINNLQRDYGLTPEQASGVAGNFGHESSWRTEAVGPTQDYGLAQWQGPRRKALEQFASSNGLDLNDRNTQYAFFQHEIATMPGIMDSLRNAQSPEEAVRAFGPYEHGNSPGSMAEWERTFGDRVKWAHTALGQMAQQDQNQPKSPENPFAKFGYATSTTTPPTPAEKPRDIGVVGQTGVGINNELANTIGAPVDALTWALNKTGLDIKNPAGGSESIKKLMGTVGANPEAQPAPIGTAETAARNVVGPGIGMGVSGFLAGPVAGPLGEAVASGASKIPVVGDALSTLSRIAGSTSTGKLGTDIAMGTGAEVGSHIAQAVAPEKYKTEAAILGGFGGGAAFGVLPGVVSGLTSDVARGAIRSVPLTRAAQEEAAANRFRTAATNPEATTEALAKPTEIVPGSAGTSAEVTGDPGIAELERAQRVRNPVLPGETTPDTSFELRKAQQNQARVDAIENIAPGEADPAAVGDYVRGRLNEIDTMNDNALTAAKTKAQSALEEVGGEGKPEEYGEQTRAELAAARRAVKTLEDHAWEPLKERNPVLDMSPAVAGAAHLEASIPQNATRSPVEVSLFDKVKSFSDPVPFDQFQQARSETGEAITDELYKNGKTPAWRRLVLLRGELNSALATAAERTSLAGEVGAQESVPAITPSLETVLQAQAREWKAARESATNQITAGGNASPSDRGLSPVGEGRVPPVATAEGEAQGRPANPPGDQGVPSAPVEAWDKEAAEQYQAARAITAQRAQTFDRGAVGKILAEMRPGEPKLANEQVAARLFNAGPTAKRDLDQFLAATSDRPTAINLLKDYAASLWRQKVVNADGTVDLAKHTAFLKRYGDRLDQLGIRDQFDTAAKAQSTVETVERAAAWAKQQYSDSLITRFLNATDSESAASVVGDILKRSDAPTEVRKMVAQLSGGPNAEAALNGLRRATVTHLLNRFAVGPELGQTGTKQIQSAGFRKFLDAKRSALAPIFGQKGIETLNNVAADMERSQRALLGNKTTAGSDTAQNLAASAKATGAQTVIGKVMETVGHATPLLIVGHTVGGIPGMLGLAVTNAFRKLGLESADKIVAQMTMDPAFAHQLLTKYPATKAAESIWAKRMNVIANRALASAVQ